MSDASGGDGSLTSPRLLIVEDIQDDVELMLHALRRAGLSPLYHVVDTAAGIAAALKRQTWDVVLADYNVPGTDFPTILQLSKADDPDRPVIVVSGSIGEETAVELMRDGVADLILKRNLARLAPAIIREITAARRQQARRDADERFRNIVEVTGEWIWETDEDHRFTFFSDTVEAAPWFDPRSSIGRTRWELPGAEPVNDPQWRQHKVDLETRRPFRNYRMAFIQGDRRYHLATSGVPFFDRSGAWRGYRGMARDESRIIEAYRRAEEAEALLRDAVDSISEGFVVLDAADRIVMVNEAYRALYPEIAGIIRPGLEFVELLRLAVRNQIYAAAVGREQEWIAERMAEHRRLSGNSMHRLKDGRWVLITERRMRNGGTAGLRMDITALKTAEAERDYLAFHDLATGLPNQELFMDRLGQALAQLHRADVVAVFSIELLSLADIRASQGLEAGEAALRETGGRIQAALSSGGTVAHAGNGRYLAFTIEADGDATVPALVERVLAASDRRFHWDGVDVPLRLNVGISIGPADGSQAEALIRSATTALNEVKSAAGERYRFYRAEMTKAAIHRWNIEADLRRGLEQREFVLHYQPQVDARTYRIVGTEALVRWAHPERGLIAPGQFIPIAEQTGMIVALGEHVLRLACTEARDWTNDRGARVPVSVNLSAVQLAEPDLEDVIVSILRESGLPPQMLKLELTESAILSDVAAATRTMRKLADGGVQFALDDFGMEHSSLSQLSRLPIQTLKIDYTFVSKMTEDRAHAALVQAIISMTHSLGMTAVAEGVERLEQLTYLQAYGCDTVQGFLFSPPVPVASVPAVIAAGGMVPQIPGE